MEIIVAIDKQNGIGNNAKTPSLLYSLARDMHFFKEKTINNIVVCGRKTFDSFKDGKPLPNRKHLVLSHNNIDMDDVECFANTENLLVRVKELENQGNQVFVIGGASVYEQLLPYCKGAYITTILQTRKATHHFPLEKLENWPIDKIIDGGLDIDRLSNSMVEYVIMHFLNEHPMEY